MSIRTEMLQAAPPWLGWALFTWSLPFLWIATSMSVRRSADTGASAWIGLLVLVPLCNLIFMPLMCLLPSAAETRWSRRSCSVSSDRQSTTAVLALSISLMVGALMMVVSV